MRRRLWIAGGILLIAGMAVLVLGIERGSAPSIVLFVGRFHPTVVHFPIAFLILAILIEVLAARSTYVARVRPAVPFILLLGALSALASVVLGYLLSLGGGYDDDLLSLHMWLGLTVTVLAFGLAMISSEKAPSGRVFRGSLYVLGILVVVAGYFGGTLARGSGYMTYYLPEPLKQLAGLESGPGKGLITNVDSSLVFADLIQPILNRRCVKCHGAGKSEGDLRLDSREGIEKGGRDGSVVVTGNPSQSEILRRITLPPYDEDAMPPDGGMPLDVGETELIRWWIQSGASFEVKAGDIPETPSAVETFLARIAAPREPVRSGIYALDVPPADTLAIAEIRRLGLIVSHAAPDFPFLMVSASALRDRFTDDELQKIRPIAPQIARLDLGHTAVTSSGAALFSQMPHLTHLHLENTAVDDDALTHLAGLEYVEYLNLYGTEVSDAGLRDLSNLGSLRSVYLWQSRATEDGAGKLQAAIPGVTVNVGAELASAESDSIISTAR